VVVITNFGAIVTVNVAVVVCWGVPASVAAIVNVNVPEAVGVPLSVPVLERLKPSGRAPDCTDQLYGVLPPFAANVPEYAVPTAPFGKDGVVIENGLVTTMVPNCGCDVTWGGDALSETLTRNWNVPPKVGVPKMTPVLDRIKPGGSDPLMTAKTYGGVPPDAVIT
jgi:hypothetical protein